MIFMGTGYCQTSKKYIPLPVFMILYTSIIMLPASKQAADAFENYARHLHFVVGSLFQLSARLVSDVSITCLKN